MFRDINPPTDSLYKFCSIVGVIIFCLSWYLPQKMMDEFQEKMAKFNLSIKTDKADFEYQKYYIKDFKLTHGIGDNTNELVFNESEYSDLTIDKKAEYLRKRIVNVEDKVKYSAEYNLLLLDSIRKVDINSANISFAAKEVERNSKNLDAIYFASVFGKILGLLLFVYGFLNWYYKVQIHQDMILKRQALGEESIIKKDN